MKESLKSPYIKLIDKRGDFKIWIVDGSYIRGHIDEEFTNFGQHFKFSYIPENEVWIDDDLIGQERGYVLLHELHERNRMAEGLPYSEAHAESSKLEYHCRHHPDELHDALAAEGWA